MEARWPTTRRTVVRVEDKMRLGPDTQVDDKNVIIAPMRPEQTDPFLLLSEDWFSSPGFEWHPHRGVETVTMVVDGVLEHGDNTGNAGALATGDVQWMTAGRGIIHRELAYRDERAHTLQLWVNLPREMKMVDTRYQDLRAADRPVVERAGSRVDLISGTADGITGPALNHWPISGAVITLEPNQTLEYLLPGRDRAFFYVLAGQVEVAGRTVGEGQTAWSDPAPQADGSVITLQTGDGDRPSVVMAYSGEPIGQPVAMGGPFVMNSPAEIEQAFRGFHSGSFGAIPRQARLQYR
ncbi:pirin family protein [Streptomyces sp. NPDC005262]|uniref:pirin family protein n=1 Tax=Streptomyces sp. NPDC005262 TaxID=3364710 RepID=UPI0036A4A8EC